MRENYHENLVMYLEDNCSLVQTLNLNGIWLSGKSREYFCDHSLKNMPQLRFLHVPHIANSQMLQTLSRKCAHLTFLDLSGSQDIFEEDVLALSSLRLE